MPSKDRKQRLKKKKQYEANTVTCKKRANIAYRQNTDTVIKRAKSRRASDATHRNKDLAAHRLKLSQNDSYKEKNRASSRINTKRRVRENEDYANKNRERALVNIRRRLQEDDAYRKKNRKAATINSKRRLSSNETYRQKKIEAIRQT